MPEGELERVSLKKQNGGYLVLHKSRHCRAQRVKNNKSWEDSFETKKDIRRGWASGGAGRTFKDNF